VGESEDATVDVVANVAWQANEASLGLGIRHEWLCNRRGRGGNWVLVRGSNVVW
jgi:hypothetical protein